MKYFGSSKSDVTAFGGSLKNFSQVQPFFFNFFFFIYLIVVIFTF